MSTFLSLPHSRSFMGGGLFLKGKNMSSPSIAPPPAGWNVEVTLWDVAAFWSHEVEARCGGRQSVSVEEACFLVIVRLPYQLTRTSTRERNTLLSYSSPSDLESVTAATPIPYYNTM